MKVVFWGSFLFSLAFIIHLIIWKIRVPKSQTTVLLKIFFGVLIFGIFILLANPSIILNSIFIPPENPPAYLHICLFFTSLTLAYIVTYSALEVDSPSLVIVMIISNAGKEGLDKDVFDKCLTDDSLLKPRIKNLLRDKMVFMDREKYKLTPKGSLIAKIFLIYRNLLNIKEKGG